MAKNAFRARLEQLEQRENPSTVSALAATTTHVVSFQGSGAGTVTQFSNQINSFELSAYITGRATGLGTFTSSPKAFVYLNRHAIGAAILTASNGSTLDLTLNGTARQEGPTPGLMKYLAKFPGSPTGASARFQFKVTGGTGTFAGATGTGSGSLSANMETNTLTFSFSGKAKT
jgi:hypothetical protein